ncbi:MAG: hypothetical protein GY822_14885 [Deltaproteobacteria bacterium]|nr:hypothetical protein [Deltaproteobacteria bacterium]
MLLGNQKSTLQKRFSLLSLSLLVLGVGCAASSSPSPNKSHNTSSEASALAGASDKRKASAHSKTPDATKKIQTVVVGSITSEGRINCFAPGLRKAPSKKHPEGKEVHCETSAILAQPKGVLLASDKPIPGEGKSSLFFVRSTKDGLEKSPTKFFVQDALLHARKFEDFAPLPKTARTRGQAAFLTTGFDRVKKASSKHPTKWNVYNTLFYFEMDAIKSGREPQVVSSDGATPATSVGLRKRLSLALMTDDFPDGMPYFKTEGLVILPGNRLVFGVREKGKSYKKFSYAITLVEVLFSFSEQGVVELAETAKVILDVSPTGHVPETVGLSSLAYDVKRERLYLLTSYELEESDVGLGAYLFSISHKDLTAGKSPTLVMEKSRVPLHFAHKAEGVSVREDGDLWVIHDDDRVFGRKDVKDSRREFHRAAHQASWSLVHIEN